MKLVFYNDVRGYGGHEKTSIDLVKYILENTEDQLFYIYYKGNEILKKKLLEFQAFPKLELIEIPFYTGNYSRIFNYVNLKRFFFLKKLLNRINPDALIAVQGNIEISSLVLLLKNQLDFPVISFIPLTQTFKLSSSKYLGIVRDFLASYLYSLPNNYITISQSLKNDLIEKGVTPHKIDVAYCGMEITNEITPPDINHRYNPSLPIKLGLVGRIKFAQKNHHFLIKTLETYQDSLPDFRLIIIGDGDDSEELNNLISKSSIRDKIERYPWSFEIENIYNKFDVLLIPSVFEGVPLVQYEAMYFKLPIIGSNRDGMKELLDKNWLFNLSDPKSLIDRINYMADSSHFHEINIELDKNHKKVIDEYNTKVFGEIAYNTIKRIANG